MPYKLKRANVRKNCYTVYNPKNKHVFAKCSTKNKANKQIRLLHAIMYNPKFKPYGQLKNRQTTKNKSNKYYPRFNKSKKNMKRK